MISFQSYGRKLVELVLGAMLLVSCVGKIEGDPESFASSSSAGGGGPLGGEGPGAICPAGQTSCDGRCVDTSTDQSHCGSCGAACEAGTFCGAGSCQAFCGVGQALCAGTCKTVVSDPANCGTCGAACPAGQYCNGGTCSATCDYELCDGLSGLECANTSDNPEHCGGCGARCAAGQSCVDGVCQIVCPEGRTLCGGSCVSTETDANNCGSCGSVCQGQACIGGGCGCPEGQALCGGLCMDVLTSPEHCGSCGAACGAGSSCVLGECRCPPDKQLCGTSCVDTVADPAHCGACSTACAATDLCDQGQCRPISAGCSSGLTQCGASCIDTTASSSHCGGCDRPCPAAQSCVGSICVCPGGGALCGGACVDTQTSNTHCGTCDNPCTAGRTCSGGQCVCPNGAQFCGGACVDVSVSLDHCGACGATCSGGRTCAAGACNCSGGLSWCAGACVNTLASNEHCGGCGQACDGGRTCNGGQCVCPGNLAFCGGECTDTSASDLHCGACNAACAIGQACSGGTCSGSGGVGEDGCAGLAKNVTVSQIAVYQSVRIQVMNNGQAVANAARNADVVEGRETLVRVYVTVGAGWAARDLSARLVLTNGAAVDSYFARKSVAGSSSENDAASTFQIYVPKEKISTETRYYVELVECTTVGGSVVAPRFPAEGDTVLGVRKTGPLKVTMIPILANGRLPDTSETALEKYRSYLLAMYPVSDVLLTVGGQISTAYPINWTNTLDQVRAKRQADGPPADVYYYGLLKPTDTFAQFCNGSCTAGIGYVSSASQAASRAAVGIAWVDTTSNTNSSVQTMAHELGHNHGRNHAPCGGASGTDQNYPYSGGLLGVTGYDYRTRALIAADRTDIMGYCSNKWVSDYTYDALTARVASVNGAPAFYVLPEFLGLWRVLIIDAAGPRWGNPVTELSLPSGAPELGEALDAAGNVLELIEVYRTEIADVNGASIMIPEPAPHWHSVRVAGAPAISFNAPVAVPPP
jgi:hypothetical protein